MTTEIAKRETAVPAVSASLADTTSLGQLLARSGYFQDARDMTQAVVKVLAGRELGFGPIASMTGIYIVKGRVTLSANLMAAAIKRSGRYDYRIREHSDTACEIEFFEQGQSVGKSRFTAEDAKRAGLGGDNWRGYPRNMLFARALSNGAKWFCADIWGGPVYTPDELGVKVDGETGEPVEPARISPAPRVVPAEPVEVARAETPPAPPAAEPSHGDGTPDRNALLARVTLLADSIGLSTEERLTFWRTYCGNASRRNVDPAALADLIGALEARAGIAPGAPVAPADTPEPAEAEA